MGYGLCVDVQKSGTTQIQNVLDKGYNLLLILIIEYRLYTKGINCYNGYRNKFIAYI